MPRYKPYNYDQLMMIPVSLEDQLAPGTLEYAIHHLIEERIDTSIFDEKYRNDDTGRCAYDPKVLLKVVLFAYSRGILHSRRMERACRENVTFMALTCGQAPDHSTLAAFVSSMGEEKIVDLFTQVLLVCEEEGLLGGDALQSGRVEAFVKYVQGMEWDAWGSDEEAAEAGRESKRSRQGTAERGYGWRR